jgi:hypothetical protein
MRPSGFDLARAIDDLTGGLQISATEVRNKAFAEAGQEFLESYDVDPSPKKLRLLMTRFRGDGDEELNNNIDVLLADYPELANVDQKKLESLTLQLSKAARLANRLLSIERVKFSIVRSVIRPVFQDFPLERLQREKGFPLSFFNQEDALDKAKTLGSLEVSIEGFPEWTRSVYDLFLETSVMPQSSSRNMAGTRMPGVVNSLNIRRYTNVWFAFTAEFQEQIFQQTQNLKLDHSSKTLGRSTSLVWPRYSSVNSDFTYTNLSKPITRISIALRGITDSSPKSTRDWVSKESFEKEFPTWMSGVLDMLALAKNEFCIEVKIKAGSTQAAIEIKNRDAATACKDALRFLDISLTI